ncbi:MAG TPA: MBL fold metallo-hydrolase [Candidatus Limnocylindrales bacterium]|nr:MBL fold metallo-hydrolase [Candidatus Limnocylindrales bacterium]
MRLTVLGAGPAYTDRLGAVGASYLVTSGGTNLLLDLGHGAFANLAGTLEPSTLSAIAISHLHPDHFIDLVPLRHYLRYDFRPPRRVRVSAPAALATRVDALLAQPGFTAESLDVDALSDGLAWDVGEVRVEARKVTHTDDSYAFRVSAAEGPGLVYSGDCGRASDLRPLIQPGDVLLSEVSFGLGPVPDGAFHLDAGDVGSLAGETGARRILLTHLLAGRDRAATEAATSKAAGGIEAMLVDPGDRFEL